MRRLAVLASAVLIFACKPSSKPTKPPAMSPDVEVSGVIVGPEGLPDRPLESGGREIAVGFDGTSYLVVWTQPGGVTLDDIWAARMTASGELIGDAFPIAVVAGNQQTPAVVFDGQNYLVVFQDHRAGPYLNTYGARVRADGTVVDPGGFPISTQVDHQSRPAVAFDGAGFFVVWADRRNGKWDVYGARVARDATVVDADGRVVATATNVQSSPVIAFDGTNYLVAWQDSRDGGGFDIRAARVTPAGVVLDPNGIVVSVGNFDQSSPALSFDGQNFVVAWQDSRSGTPRIFAARVSSAGAVLDGSGIPITPAAGRGTTPAIAYDGAYTLVAWQDPSLVPTSVRGARLDPSGAVLDPDAFLVASGTGGRSVAVASDRAGRALVAYDAVDAATGAVRVRGRVLTDWVILSVAKAGRGAGTVASTPNGIDCGETCSHRFDAPTDVSLVATPDGDSVFGGWSGACEGTAACTVTTDASKSVTARFRALYPLTVQLGSAITGGVTSQPAGIDCGATCTHRFAEGENVQLTAQGIPGYSLFKEWTGGDCGLQPQVIDPEGRGFCGVTVDGPVSQTATFVRAYTVTLATSGAGTGTVAMSGLSCTTGSTCRKDIEAGTVVTVTATPAAGSVFKSWTGCAAVEGTPNVCTTTLSGARTVTAKFEPGTIPLTAVPTGSGSGTVTGAGLECTTGSAAGCTAAVPNPPDSPTYTTVTLTATPSAGSVFKSWTGCAPVAGAPNTCTVTVNVARTVWAKFEPSTIPLTAVTSGNGSGTVTGAGLNCTSGSTTGCTAAVPNPPDSSTYTTVTLTATASPGSVFKAWTACATVPEAPNTCTVTVGAARTVTAKFEPDTVPLIAVTSGNGSGTVTGAGLNCTTGSTIGCTAAVPNPPYTLGYSTVTLTATASAGSVFKSWVGCAPVDGAPHTCTTTAFPNKTVTAKFEPDTVPLTAVTSGTGAGTVTGAGLDCTTGSTAGCTAAVPNPPNTSGYATVTLSATPSAGSVFKSWIGCAAVEGAPSTCTVVATPGKTVTAKFEPDGIPLTAVTSGTGGGTVTGAGLNCTTGLTDGCTALVPNPNNTPTYQTVTLTATANAESVFKSWTGCSQIVGTNTCTVLVNYAKTVTAKFEPSTVPLTAVTSGTGSGTVTGAGLDCTTGSTTGCTAAVPNPPNISGYATVTLTATPSAGSVFKSWTGCTPVEGAPNTCTVVATPGRSVTAKFELNAIPLTAATSGTGSGTVTGAGLNCTTGSTDGCTTYVNNPGDTGTYETVTLTATPSAGSVFKSWTGCTGVAGTNTCTVLVNYAKTVTAKFEPDAIPLSATTSGTGAGTVSGAGLNCTTGSTEGCTTSVPNPNNTSTYETVTLTATPSAGYVFKSWSGCTAVAGTNTCTVLVNYAKAVTARFEPATIPLSIVTAGTGTGTVTGPGIACTTGSTIGCSAAIENPNNFGGYTTVTLTAAASAGSTFRYWSGCTPMQDAPATCTVLLNMERTVTATFNVQ